MSRRPKHIYEIPCMRCDYQPNCDIPYREGTYVG